MKLHGGRERRSMYFVPRVTFGSKRILMMGTCRHNLMICSMVNHRIKSSSETDKFKEILGPPPTIHSSNQSTGIDYFEGLRVGVPTICQSIANTRYLYFRRATA